jgi:coenzyme F420-reducing hydrogenase alpha subunit
MSAKIITINPIIRLEGHGKIEIFLNEISKLNEKMLRGGG